MGMFKPAADTARKGRPAAVHLIAFAVAVTLPLLLLVGALLYRSVTLESEQIKQRIGQVLQALVADLDRDMDRRIAVLETLSTSPLLLAEDWPAFYAQAKQGLGSPSACAQGGSRASPRMGARSSIPTCLTARRRK